MAISNSSTPPKSQLRVLVAEDYFGVAEILCNALRLTGYDVRFGKTGLEALVLAREWAPDVAIIDLEMLGMSGCELALHLRAEHSDRIILVAHTGYGDIEHRELSAAAGFILYLVKPVPFERLDVNLSLFARGKANSSVPSHA